jgi:hypothetical protein
MAKFKKGDIVRDDCGCNLLIVSIRTPYYKVVNTTKAISSVEYDPDTKEFKDRTGEPELPYDVRIKDLDLRAKKEVVKSVDKSKSRS